MKSARDQIFEALEAARPPAAAEATRVPAPPMPEDPEALLRARLEQSGGRLQRAPRHAWAAQIEWPIALSGIEHLYIDPELVAGVDSRVENGVESGVESRVESGGDPVLAARGVGTLDSRGDVRELDALEVCVLHGEFAVVENGACWQVPRSPFERAAALLAEHLLVLVDSAALVPSLHQAYDRIDLATTNFGWFLCGPSKTADIEQALVLGAHGPRTMSLVLLHP